MNFDPWKRQPRISISQRVNIEPKTPGKKRVKLFKIISEEVVKRRPRLATILFLSGDEAPLASKPLGSNLANFAMDCHCQTVSTNCAIKYYSGASPMHLGEANLFLCFCQAVLISGVKPCDCCSRLIVD